MDERTDQTDDQRVAGAPNPVAGPPPGEPQPADDGFLQEFLSYFWMDNTDEEAQQQWRDYVRMAPDRAARMLAQLRAVLAEPPADLGERIYEWAWRSTYDEATGDWVSFDQSEALAWLRDVADDFAAAPDEPDGPGR